MLYSITAPKLSPFVSQRSITENSYFQQTCAAEEGELPLKFEWLVNGQAAHTGARLLGPRIEHSNRSSTLVISGIDRRDAGIYKCMASNRFGSDTQSVLLSVRGMTR